MKAPVWGMCCAVVCSAIFGIGVALHVAGQLRAADSPGATIGPDAPPLARPIDGAGNRLDYPNPAALPIASNVRPAENPVVGANNFAPTTVSPAPPMSYPLPPQSATAPSSYTSAPAAPGGMTAALNPAPNNGLRQPVLSQPLNPGAPAQLPVTTFTRAPRQIEVATNQAEFDPQQPAPINGVYENAEPNAAASSRNTWTNIQTAFRQPADPNLTAGNSSPPSNSAPFRSGGKPGPADATIIPGGGPVTPSVRVDGVHPSTSGPMSTEMIVPGGEMMGQMPMSGPDPTNGITQVMPRGNCGCGGGGPGSCGELPPGQYNCPNCGGWQPGSCSNHNPDGSCILQRLACCLCKPYPDCSNGCIDFCHSWIFHEDDCWCTSNHKCCANGCGPYPYGGCPNDGMGKGVGCGCGNCGPCVAPPDYYFTLEGFSLGRDNQTNRQDIVTSGGATALNTGDFNFDWETGPSITFGYRPTKIDAWEITYFGLNSWDDRHSLTGSGDLALPGDLGAAAGLNFSGADSMIVTYSSEIHSAEVNYLWHECGCECQSLQFLFGIRYFHLDEELNIDSTVTGVGSSFYDIRTENDLYGVQLGLRYKKCCHRFTCEANAKAGVFGDSTVDRQLVSNEGESPIRSVDFRQGHWAFVGELGATVGYHLCDCLELVAGGGAIFVDGVALAPDQLDFTNTPTSGTMLDHAGQLFLYGGHAGIACRW